MNGSANASNAVQLNEDGSMSTGSLAELLKPLDDSEKITADSILAGERENGEQMVLSHPSLEVLLGTPDKLTALFAESHKAIDAASSKYQPGVASQKRDAIIKLRNDAARELLAAYDAAERKLRLVVTSTTHEEAGLVASEAEELYIARKVDGSNRMIVDDFLAECRDAVARRHRALLREYITTLAYLLETKRWYQSRRSDVVDVLRLMRAAAESPLTHAQKFAAETCDALRQSLRAWVRHLEGGGATDEVIRLNMLHPFQRFIRKDKAA